MREDVSPGADASRKAKEYGPGRGGPLSVGSGDVDARDGEMRIAEGVGERGDILQAEFLNAGTLRGTEGRLARRGEFFTQGKKGVNGLVVIHKRVTAGIMASRRRNRGPG